MEFLDKFIEKSYDIKVICISRTRRLNLNIFGVFHITASRQSAKIVGSVNNEILVILTNFDDASNFQKNILILQSLKSTIIPIPILVQHPVFKTLLSESVLNKKFQWNTTKFAIF